MIVLQKYMCHKELPFEKAVIFYRSDECTIVTVLAKTRDKVAKVTILDQVKAESGFDLIGVFFRRRDVSDWSRAVRLDHF